MSKEIIEAEGRASLVLAGTVSRGDLLGYSAGWVRADSDLAAGPIFAQWVSLEAGVSGDRVAVARRVVYQDTAVPYTAGGVVYVSGTAGGHTQTRPTAEGALVQRIGVALATDTVVMEIRPPTEMAVMASWIRTGSAESKLALDSGDVYGDQLDAGSENSHFLATVPENCVGLVEAKALAAVETDVNFDWTVNVSAFHDSEQHDDTVDTATANAVDLAPDSVNEVDISGAFNAAGVLEPGQHLAIEFLRDTAGTDILILVGIRLVFLVV